MGESEEACERLLESIQEAVSCLERGKQECSIEDWDVFTEQDFEEIVERLRDMASKLNMKITQLEELDVEE
jgi:hypothetical protein